MKSTNRSFTACLGIFLSLIQFDLAALPQAPSPPASSTPPGSAPIPALIASSHTVFLSNLGADANFPIEATQVYNDIYKALQAWGRYQLVGSPEQADLVFQLRDVSTLTDYSGTHGSIYTVNTPSFQLTMVDPKSNVTLWTITSPVTLAGSKQTLAQWISISETNLVSRIKVAAGQTLSATETADLTTVPKTHNRLALFIILGGAAAGSGLLVLLYEHSKSSAKASQDAFCTANHVPLSECAGG
jgi:hypothetical protein